MAVRALAQSARGEVSHLRRLVGNISTRATRAARAFRVGEYDYHLALLEEDGLYVAYREGTADESVLKHSLRRDIFLPGVPEYQPRSSDTVIEVGSHIGTFTVLIARQVDRVYAIEPSRETFDYLRINCLLNRLDNVRPFHLALGQERGLATLYHDRENWGHTTMKQLTHESETVPMATLTDFMADQEIDRCDFLRMNCEGAEFPILLCTPPETLERVDAMLVSYHCDLVSVPLESLVAHIRRAGLEVEIRNRTSPYHGWLVAFRRGQAAGDGRE